MIWIKSWATGHSPDTIHIGVSIMSNAELFKSSVWDQFQTAARRQRRDPSKVLMDYMRECLEIWEDKQLDQEIQTDARRSDYSEEDAVEIVQQLRREKAVQRPAAKDGRKRTSSRKRTVRAS